MKNRIIEILIILLVFLAGISVYFGLSGEYEEITENEAENVVENEENVIITDEIQEIVEETKTKVENGEDLSTTEEIISTEDEEKKVEEEEVEVDAQVEQEGISYDGDSSSNRDGLSLVGEYQGLTYYSQLDSRWANTLYTSTNNSTQTIGSSGCGITAGAIVVSSSKGTILPTTMASLSVANGYRTANNGTAWAYFPFIADYFGFEEYHSTSNFDTAISYLKTDNDSDGVADYFVVVSCGSGLFTTRWTLHCISC